MHQKDIFLTTLVLLCSAALVVAQTTSSRCFQFTWLGPRYNNESTFLNATCDDATRLTTGVPCQQPLVVSYDGTWPDVDYIWQYHSQAATCVLANNDVCAQYTYYFDGHVENSTYMCTRAVDTDGAAVTSGCHTQVNGSYTTRVCLCRSVPGGVPCNSANSMISYFTMMLTVTVAINSNFLNILRKIFV